MSSKVQLSPRRLLIDGALLAGAFTSIAVGSLWLDARIWIEDYPPDIRAAAGPGTVAPLPLRIATAAVLFGVMVGGLALSNWLVARDGERVRFRTLFVHTVALFWIVNLADVLVVDWLVFVTVQPGFVVLPGTEGLPGYGDYMFHLRGSFLSWRPWLVSVVLAAALAATVTAARRRLTDLGE